MFLSILTGCGTYEEVEFKNIDQFKVTSIKGSLITVEGLAVFHNPNSIRAKLTKTNIEVFMDGEKITTLEPAGKVIIRKNNDFEVPIKATIDISQQSAVNSILQMFTKKQREIRLKGYITIQVFPVRKRVDIDYTVPLGF